MHIEIPDRRPPPDIFLKCTKIPAATPICLRKQIKETASKETSGGTNCELRSKIMPSGSKKRKSAKRKKENDASNHLHPSSLRGFGYVNHQEYIETNLLRAGEEEEIGPGDSISNLPSVQRLKNEGVEEENSVVEEGNVVLAEKESCYSNGTDKLVDPARRDYDGSKPERSSSSISSYDESRGFEKIKSITGDVPAVDPCKEEDSLSEFHPAVDLEENLILKQNGQVNMSSRNDSSVASLLVNSARKESREKGESCVKQKAGISEYSSSERENDAVVQSVDDRMTLSYNEPSATANGGVQNGKHSEVTEPLLAPRQPTQTTSWKSCCGLFAIFTGHGR